MPAAREVLIRRPLDVLHVVESLGQGGAEQNLLAFLRCLPEDRFRNHIAWLYDDTRLLESFRPHVNTLLPLGARGSKDLLAATLALAGWMRANRPSVVHAQLVMPQLAARAASLLARRPPVVTTWQSAFYVPEAITDYGGSRLRQEIVRLLDRLSGRINHHFIAVSEFVASHCSEKLGVSRDRITVIHNAVDPERYQAVQPTDLARARAELGLAKDAKVILTVGRIVISKAHADVIAALSEIRRRVPEAVFVVAGDGPLRNALVAQAESMGLAGAIRLPGLRKDVAALYQLADLFAFPTRFEGLSVALVEALANGLPAVVSDIPQNREIGEGMESVRFIPVGDIGALTRAAVDLLTAGTSLRDAARLRAQELRVRFGSAALAARFADTLERAASGPPSVNAESQPDN